jgi:hypothetical protein
VVDRDQQQQHQQHQAPTSHYQQPGVGESGKMKISQNFALKQNLFFTVRTKFNFFRQNFFMMSLFFNPFLRLLVFWQI